MNTLYKRQYKQIILKEGGRIFDVVNQIIKTC